MNGPLHGIRVVEMTVWQQGPEAGAMLADMGAEVIKVERPFSGDPGRGVQQLSEALMSGAESGINYYFESHNRNKKGLAIDATKPKGRDIIYKLVQKADVFLTNFIPASMEKLGLDYDSLAKQNPKLIYAMGSSYGVRGPGRNRESMDIAGQARSGIMTLIGAEPGQAPRSAGLGTADQVGAFMLAYGVMTALFARERTGQGQMVSASLLGTMIAAQGHWMQAHLVTGQQPSPRPRADARNPFWNMYQTKDNRWLVLSMTRSDQHWHNLCQALEIPDVENDLRFPDHDQRLANAKVLIAIMDRQFAKRTLAEWVERLEKAKLVFAPVNVYADVVADPAVWDNDYIVEDVHPIAGKMRMVGSPVYLSKTPAKAKSGAPELGQHTEEVLTEICGYSWDDLIAFKDERIIM